MDSMKSQEMEIELDDLDVDVDADVEVDEDGEPIKEHRRPAAPGKVDYSLPQDMLIRLDLDKSGLVAGDDLYVMPYDANIRQALNGKPEWKGYGIRYHDPVGKELAYYRFRLLIDTDVRYRSVRGTTNHVYFPKKFMANYNIMQKKIILVVEGEKKAALLAKHGYPCVAFSGTDCWINRSMILPKDIMGKAEPHPQLKNMMTIKIDPERLELDHVSGYAKYFEELVELARRNQSTIILCYDTDMQADPEKGEYKVEVQRSAARLAYELRNRGLGVKQIKQMVLPNITGFKTGPDDFIMHEHGGLAKFKALFNQVLQKEIAFPNYPNIREYISKQLGKRSLSRKATQQLATAVLSDLDRRGKRMYAPNEGQLYYFNGVSKQLMKVPVNDGVKESINETDFGRLLYKEYDISPVADGRLIQWLGTILPSEDPIEDVNPSRIFARPAEGEDCVRFQLNDGQFIKVTGDPNKPYQILDNGQDSTLFTSGNQIAVDGEELRKALGRQFTKKVEPWWFEVLKEVKLKERGHAAMAMGLLYYISPWLYRWRGTQLPVEMVCGESGSGKSTLVSLRLNILMGMASLRNAPTDLKDWYAQITQSGGMHVTDNLHFTDKQLAQRMSDELAQPLDAKVLTPTGYSTIGETVVGDTILDPWGRKVKVLKEHPHGTKSVYKVTLSDGSSTESTLDHKWLVQTRDDLVYNQIWRGKVLSLKDIMDKGLRYAGKNARNKWIIPSVLSTIDLTNSEIDYSCYDMINPYVMGCLLGDGNLNSKQVWFANGDQDIVDKFASKLPEGVDMNSSQQYSYYLRGDRIGEFKKHLDNLGLREVLARTKFIPKQYMLTSASERLELLRGLMDTDGTVRAACTGTAQYSTLSKQLAEDVQFIVQSLGGRSNLSQRADLTYQVSVSLPENVNPFSCKRKVDTYEKFNVRRKIGWRSITSIDYVGEKEVKCISVDTKEGLYVTDNFIVTHNCRLVTEPLPTIEQRKYFTNAELIRFPINAIFSFTAIKQPFNNADLIQRAFILELDKVQAIKDVESGEDKDYAFDSMWLQHQLKRFGGRTEWIAHHLHVLHKFFILAEKEWKWDYKAKYRLINLEQCMILMAKVLGQPYDWIPDYLAQTTNTIIKESDWVLQGLRAFADDMRKKHGTDAHLKTFSAADISNFANAHEDFEECSMLVNTRTCGRYMQTAKYNIATIAGIVEAHKQGNRQLYHVTKGAPK